MRVHHLNCGTMHPASRRLTNGTGGLFEAGTMVCHCLLVETEQGLVLVDTGFGAADIKNPFVSLGGRFVRMTRPALDPDETAASQVTRLGYQATDVRHIVLTHLDPDHAGGLSDFSWATVHLHAAELEAGLRPSTRKERSRYRSGQWAHGPNWTTYQDTNGEAWFGFMAAQQLTGLPPDILLISMAGHSRGHCGVAVDTGTGWLMHAGDTYFSRQETDPVRPSCPLGPRVLGNLVQTDGAARRANLVRLRKLRAAHSDRVRVFCAHDETELPQ